MTSTTPRTQTSPKPERRFVGISVSPGIARGPAFVQGTAFQEPESFAISGDGSDAEIERLGIALGETREQIEILQKQLADAADGKNASIFDAHLLILEDKTVLAEVENATREDGVNIEAAFYRTMTRYIDRLRNVGDPYLSERAIDIEDVTRRVLRNLARTETTEHCARQPHIVISAQLTPSDTVAMDRKLVRGFVTEVGSYTSHTAIIARSLGLPAVVGLPSFCAAAHTGDQLLIDGYNGLAIIDPSPETLAEYEALAAEKDVVTRRLEELRESESKTSDDHGITLSANIEFDHETAMAKERGARGIGLYRTEFFYMHAGSWPSEDQQTKNYTRVAKGVAPDGVIIRTLDIGGDKLPESAIDTEENPFLGYRGIRVSLDRVDVFKTQLRSILRASGQAKVGVMFPMISTRDELLRAKELLAECAAELDAEDIAYDRDLEVGAMIEVPSAALITDQLAGDVDFFSIGTNDLIQYTMAVDRVNERVADLYQPLNPAVVRLINMTVQAGHTAGIWVGVCGEMASDILFTPLLVGLGVDELSVGAPSVPAVKHAIRSLSFEECKTMAAGLAHASSPEEIFETCRAMALERYPELIT